MHDLEEELVLAFVVDRSKVTTSSLPYTCPAPCVMSVRGLYGHVYVRILMPKYGHRCTHA